MVFPFSCSFTATEAVAPIRYLRHPIHPLDSCAILEENEHRFEQQWKWREILQQVFQEANCVSQPAWAWVLTWFVWWKDVSVILPDALVAVADRIDGPYNVDTVIGTIHMRISEAISNLQENKDSITAKVRACA